MAAFLDIDLEQVAQIVERGAGVAEAALLRMIFEAGLRAIRERAEELAYASAAEDRRSGEDADADRRIARRRRPAWADED